MSVKILSERALQQGNGILRLAPTWVPRAFCVPGRRIKLHPDDYYALGGKRGGIDERWLASTTPADNGPETAPDEGLSQVVIEDGARVEKVLLRDVIAELKGALIGERLWNRYGQWPLYSKFFDNKGALPFHIHHRDEHAALIGQLGKPEAYYFPPQMNNYGGDFPYTFFGLKPNTTRQQLRQCLEDFDKGDNHILDLSVSYRLVPGAAWDVPAGTLHAPGSLCTYEPQQASDVSAIYQSLTGDSILSSDLLWKNVPPERAGDLDFFVELVDWESNVDPDFAARHFMALFPVKPPAEMAAEGYQENWVCYKSPAFSASELTVQPGRTVVIRGQAAFGLIVVQGHGRMGSWEIESPALIRYSQLTYDEFFVSEDAARAGVIITNPSRSDPIVMLKHFGPGNPDLVT